MSQLTITLDDNLLQAAQKYARRHGQEMDTLVAQLLANTVRPAASEPPRQTTEERLALVYKLAGSLKVPADFDYKQELEDGLAEKYEL